MARWMLLLILGVSMAPLSGCGIGAFFGFIAANARETGSHDEPAEYEGLEDKSFAVIVAADRSIQADHAGIVARLTSRVTGMLIENTEATGVVPPQSVLGFQYNTPQWTAMPYSEVADEFRVDRLIVIDLQEYRLHDPGNRYLWDPVAAASVVVLERDSVIPDEFAFRKFVEVGFPEIKNLGPQQAGPDVVRTELANRLANRVAWLFYDKEVPNNLEY